MDTMIRFYDSEGNEVCELHFDNKKCSTDEGVVYASLDVDETNVSSISFQPFPKFRFTLFRNKRFMLDEIT